jgi:tetratricopeptide (TPR) repeat protein
MRPGPLRLGQDFGPRYHVLKLLGSGGMGVVYQALDRDLGIEIALKVLRAPAAGPKSVLSVAEMQRRFKTELLLARQITHKNVIRIHDIGEIDGIRFISMPLVKGPDLATLLKNGPLSVTRAVRCARQIAAGLAAVHAAGVVHRDLKPANVMVGEDDQAILMDFGIARSTAPGTPRTIASAVVGTLAYMAPEQARSEAVDQRTDIYAFGLILYEMLSGPRATMTMADLLARMKSPPISVRHTNPQVPEALDAIVTRCLQPAAADRFQTATELATALASLGRTKRRFAAGPMASRKWMSRAAVAALLAMLGAGAYWMTTPRGTAVLTKGRTMLAGSVRALNPATLFAGERPNIADPIVPATSVVVPAASPPAVAMSRTREEARNHYKRLEESGPAGASIAKAGLADLALSEGRPKEAAEILEPAIAIDLKAGNPAAASTKYLALAEARRAQERPADAVNAVRQAVSTSRDENVLMPAARLLVTLGEEREARALARELDASAAPHADAYARIVESDLALADGRPAEAIATLRRVLETSDLWIVRLLLGTAYLQSNRVEEALGELEVCYARRDEAAALFDPFSPSMRYVRLLEELVARAREELATLRGRPEGRPTARTPPDANDGRYGPRRDLAARMP